MERTHTHFSTCSVVPHGKNIHTLQDTLGFSLWEEHMHIRTCSVVAHGKDIYTLQDMLGGAAVLIST